MIDPFENIVFRFLPYTPPGDGEDIVFRFGVEDDTISLISTSQRIVVRNTPSTMYELYSTPASTARIIVRNTQSTITPCIVLGGGNGMRIKISQKCLDIDGNEKSKFQVTPIPEIKATLETIRIRNIGHALSGGQYVNLPSQRSSYYNTGWIHAPGKTTRNKTAWGEAEDVRKEISTLVQNATPVITGKRTVWTGRMYQASVDSIQTDWIHAPVVGPAHVSSAFVAGMEKVHSNVRTEIDTFPIDHCHAISTGYLYPPRNHRYVDVSWDTLRRLATSRSTGYRYPPKLHRRHGVPWGPYWYSLLCKSRYFAPSGDLIFKFYETVDQETQELILDLSTNKNIKCPYTYRYSGKRDSYTPQITPGTPDDPYLIVPVKGFYYMINVAYIRRISGNMESIDFKSVSMSIDRDSWLWSFNITIRSKASLDLIKPQGSTLQDLEIYCNGWKWTCRVENWKENISFGKRTWTVTGRSPSIELASPYSSIPTYSNTEMQGGQIVDLLLADTGWTAEWNNDNFDPFTEWLTPAGVLNVSDSSAIKTIQQVTDSISSFVQTNADTNENDDGEKKLIIKPTYAQNVWNWADMTPSVMLTDAICREIGRQNQTYSEIDSVIVTAENQGVIVNAVRDGYAGTKPAAMCIDAMITTRDAGRERARHIISKSGFWIVHSLSLFSLMAPGDAPGLLLPGDFVGVNESGTTWKGQVTGTSITAEWGATGVNVGQAIEVEQYIGE